MIYKGQIGAVIRLTGTDDMSWATELEIRYQTPSGETGAWTASLTSGDVYSVEYVTTSEDDLSEAGVTQQWMFQGYAYSSATGWTDFTNQVYGPVGRVIDAA